MADDIDIEEHDVLDNPHIQQLFPDLSVIKKEITQYFDEASVSQREPLAIEQDDSMDSDIPSHTASQNSDQTIVYGNKIILGSKPNTSNELKDKLIKSKLVKVPKIVLQDLQLYLERNKRFCNICLILFPRPSCLYRHKKQMHTKITTSIKQNDTKSDISNKPSLSRQCKICKCNLHNPANLSRHMRTIHKNKKVSIVDKLEFEPETEPFNVMKTRSTPQESKEKICEEKRQIANVKKSTMSNLNKCNICGNSYSCKGNLYRHYKKTHNKKVKFVKQSKPSSTHNKDKIKRIELRNSSPLPSDNIRTLRQRVPKENKKNIENENECTKCNFKYSSEKALQRHNEMHHKENIPLKNVKKHDNLKLKESINKINEVILNDETKETTENKYEHTKRKSKINKCSICNKNFSSIVILIGHYKEIHKIKVNYKDSKEIIEASTSKHKSVSERKSKNESNRECFHCKKMFPDAKSLIEHVYEHLDPKKFQKSNETSSNKDNEHIIHDNDESNDDVNNDSIVDGDNDTSVHGDDGLNESESMDIDELENEIIAKEDMHQKADSCQVPKDSDTKNKDISNKATRPPRATVKKNNTNDFTPDTKENVKSKKNKKVFVCPICTYYFESIKSFYNHLVLKHNTTKTLKMVKESFSPQCRYCPSKSINVSAHNLHIYKYHADLLYKKIKKNEINDTLETEEKVAYAFNNVAYKCNKCDIHFLSAKLAQDHKGHMEMLINWKCHCQRIFKEVDAKMHLKQHTIDNNIMIYDIDENEYANLLFKCTKCAIHFNESQYFEHYDTCEQDVCTGVTYCTVCDILIDEMEFKHHASEHEANKCASDFNIIVCDIISNKQDLEQRKQMVDIVRTPVKRLHEHHNCLTYCPTCKCFLSHVGLSRKAHIQSRCSDITKHVCNLCGLVLTNKTLGVHKKYHKTDKSLCIQNFKFYDLQGNLINPPIPEYPRCDNCDVYFTNKIAVRNHFCNELKYLKCDVCHIKLSESAHKLHMYYHTYSTKSAQKKKSCTNDKKDHDKGLDDDIIHIESESQSEVEPKDLKRQQEPVVVNNINNIVNTAEGPFGVLYSCKNCFITVDVYDKLIEHCQTHYNSASKIQANRKKNIICNICSFQFDDNSYESHQNFHATSFKILYIDPTYFTSDNKVWIEHVFGTLSKDIVSKLIGESIYRYEHRVVLHVVQSGPPKLTVYKCYLCGNFIDPDYIYKHMGCKTDKIRKYPCTKCGLPLISNNSRVKHELIHSNNANVNVKTLNIVVFNKTEDKSYIKQILSKTNIFILFQCRICYVVIEKSSKDHECNRNVLLRCPKCDLLFLKTDYGEHVEKHKNIINYTSKNMKVILFGHKEKREEEEKVGSNFYGMVYDYTLYRCKHCEICVKNFVYVSKHVCIFGTNRSQCPECHLYFTSKAYSPHLKTHKVDPEFKIENMNLLTFDLSEENEDDVTINPISHDNVETDVQKANEDVQKIMPSEENIATNKENVNPIVLFRCKKCGLHYMEKSEVVKHTNNCNIKSKICKQNCAKCDLIFTPTELFSHLLNHHGNKCKSNKYYIVEMVNVINDTDINTLYRCSKCNSHFEDETRAYEHFGGCNVNNINDCKAFECNKCELYFNTQTLNKDGHEETCSGKYEIMTICKELIVDQNGN